MVFTIIVKFTIMIKFITYLGIMQEEKEGQRREWRCWEGRDGNGEMGNGGGNGDGNGKLLCPSSLDQWKVLALDQDEL